MTQYGTNIELSNPDIYGDKSGTTYFERVYLNGTNTSFTSPLSYNNRYFRKCIINGKEISNSSMNLEILEDLNVFVSYDTNQSDSIHILSPNGGEVFIIDSLNKNIEIYWESNFDDDIRIDLFSNNDSLYTITNSTKNGSLTLECRYNIFST